MKVDEITKVLNDAVSRIKQLLREVEDLKRRNEKLEENLAETYIALGVAQTQVKHFRKSALRREEVGDE